jgi:hypothetical protein
MNLIKYIFLSIIIYLVIYFTVYYSPKKSLEDFQADICGTTSYTTASIYFQKEDTLTISIDFIFFVDSLNEEIDLTKCQESINTFNDFTKTGRIKAIRRDINIVVNSEYKKDMPSFIKHGIELARPKAITCLIYGSEQNNFPDDLKNISGIAKGISSTMFAIRTKKDSLHSFSNITFSHELCHTIGLWHVDTPDPTDGYNICQGDKVSDTPSETDLHQKIDCNCKYIGNRPIKKTKIKNLTNNLMSWSKDSCRILLTEGQFDRARYEIHNNYDLRACLIK